MAKAMVEIIVVGGVFLLMLLLILLLILLACKPWRYFSRSSRTRTIKVDDLERPLVSEDPNLTRSPINDFARNNAAEETSHLTEGNFSSSRAHGLGYKQRIPSKASQLTQSGSFVLNVEDIVVGQTLVGQTLRVPLVTNDSAEELKSGREEDLSYDSKFGSENDSFREFVPKGSCLTLEVISGPSRGLRCSVQSTNTSRLPLTLGRVSPSDLLLKDSEVSGKHALINWNLNKSKWELVDMGSLNGTLLNSQTVHYPDSGSRHWGEPTGLENGDVITLGTTSKILVHITSRTEYQIPFGVAVASDPMALRRGGKKLPMEDVCYYQWPIPGTDQFGLFGICDGHGGASAATSASKLLPEMVASILSDTGRRTRVLSKCDASDVLRDAFLQTEARMNHYYEGCTATVLLVWADGHENFFAQCANVGDSACVINIDGKQIKMTEDHRITSYSERLRIQETGEPLKDGETRLCGLNLARMLGDKFLKQQDVRFSSEPYISQVVYINQESRGFALLASDGFWDVVNFKKAFHLVHRTRERDATGRENTAEKIANFLLSEARSQRTKDNTSIIFLDFDTSRISCKPDS
ncbi:protein phosphatase 2C 70 [Cornus florida]|uniref:protein phosphatase 2C 70 n=1 Tax=Cornus florida TaxID=4283 RepID=UPI002897728B|nr:protein phosphatase 2C 70 [Cornus florida]